MRPTRSKHNHLRPASPPTATAVSVSIRTVLLSLEHTPRPIELKPEYPVIRILVRVFTIVAQARARNTRRWCRRTTTSPSPCVCSGCEASRAPCPALLLLLCSGSWGCRGGCSAICRVPIHILFLPLFWLELVHDPRRVTLGSGRCTRTYGDQLLTLTFLCAGPRLKCECTVQNRE